MSYTYTLNLGLRVAVSNREREQTGYRKGTEGELKGYRVSKREQGEVGGSGSIVQGAAFGA